MSDKLEKHKTYLDHSAENVEQSVPDYAVNRAILSMAEVLSGHNGAKLTPDDAQELYGAIKDLCESQMY